MGKSTRASEDQGPGSFCGYSIDSGRQRGQIAQKKHRHLENQHLNAVGEPGEDFPGKVYSSGRGLRCWGDPQREPGFGRWSPTTFTWQKHGSWSQPYIHQHPCKYSWCQAWQSCWCPLRVSPPKRHFILLFCLFWGGGEKSVGTKVKGALFPSPCGPLGAWQHCFFFCFRKMPFTLSPPWYKPHLSQQGRMEKPLDGKSEKLFGRCL